MRDKLHGLNAYNHDYKGENGVQFVPVTLGEKEMSLEEIHEKGITV